MGRVLYTWLFGNGRQSVLGAVLFDFVGNATGQLSELSPAADRYRTL